MLKLAVKKDALLGYTLCIYKEGSGIQEHIVITEDNVKGLVSGCDFALSGGTTSSTTSTLLVDKVVLDSKEYGNQLLINVNSDYIKCYSLSVTEVKLFKASLKRAIDG